jgi:hypothetical protein
MVVSRWRGLVFCLLITCGPGTSLAQITRPAVPVDAVTGILDAFKSYPVVALGEMHGSEQGHAFHLALLRDPRFAATVDDILVEFGSGRYQDLIDSFVTGEDVSEESLRHVWQDTTVPGPVWDAPIYADFFRAVRSVNRALPANHRLRVLLGDAPIDWDQVKTAGDLRTWGLRKDDYAGNLVRAAVAEHHRVLVIYGDGHLQGRGFPMRSLMNVMEQSPGGVRVFAIGSSFGPLRSTQEGIDTWPAPSITLVRDTLVGVKPYALFYPLPPVPGYNKVRLEDQFDAILYLGSEPITISRIDAALCRDQAYMTMRLRRMALGVAPAVRANTDALKAWCAAQISK